MKETALRYFVYIPRSSPVILRLLRPGAKGISVLVICKQIIRLTYISIDRLFYILQTYFYYISELNYHEEI